jgi:HAD superfamily hydrolase (TIGR01490 family)
MMRLSFYDLDRTITRHSTFTPFLLHVAWSEAKVRLGALPLWIGAMLCHACGLFDRKALKQFGFAMFIGRRISTQRACALAAKFADCFFNQRLQPGALESLEKDRRAGRRLILVTAAPEVYAIEFARRLGMDDVIATRHCRDKDGAILNQIDGSNCHGNEKLFRARDWLRRRSLARAACHIRVYSDDLSDAPLLNFADEAVLVTARLKLADIARRHGWKSIDFERSPGNKSYNIQGLAKIAIYLPIVSFIG